MRISEFATNKTAEVEGVWQEVGLGAELKIARAGNPKYTEYLRQLAKPYRARLRRRDIPEDIAEAITIKALAKHVLLDWKGIEDEHGELIPYSVEKAENLLKEYPDFRELVAVLSDDMTLFQIESDEEVVEEVKNT